MFEHNCPMDDGIYFVDAAYAEEVKLIFARNKALTSAKGIENQAGIQATFILLLAAF